MGEYSIRTEIFFSKPDRVSVSQTNIHVGYYLQNMHGSSVCNQCFVTAGIQQPHTMAGLFLLTFPHFPLPFSKILRSDTCSDLTIQMLNEWQK
jgi:hypothetical protein